MYETHHIIYYQVLLVQFVVYQKGTLKDDTVLCQLVFQYNISLKLSLMHHLINHMLLNLFVLRLYCLLHFQYVL